MGNFISGSENQVQPVQYSQIKRYALHHPERIFTRFRGSEASQAMYHRLSEYGFVVLALEEGESATIDNMFEVGKKFFALGKDVKAVHADPKNEAMGYVNVAGVREHIKVWFTACLPTLTNEAEGKWRQTRQLACINS